jgi:flagellar biosynthesis/type III secretory pathway protein FliH
MNLNDFLAFVEFVKDVDKYQERVSALKAENDRLEKNIELTAQVANIPRVKELTEKKLEEAREILAAAQAEAVAIKEKAKSAYEARKVVLDQKETQAAEALSEGRRALQEARELHATLVAEAKRELADLQKRQEQVSQVQQEVTERLSKLKSVMG